MQNLEYLCWGIIALFGLIMWLNIFIKKFKYEKVNAKVIFTKDEYINSGESWGKGNHCKYEFVYNYNKYVIEDSFYESSVKIKEGDNVEIFIDSNNPYKFLTPAKIKNGKIYLACFIFGILAMFIF